MAFTQVTMPSFFTRYKPLFIGGGVALAGLLLGVTAYTAWFFITSPLAHLPDEYQTVLSNLTEVFKGLEDEVAAGDTEGVRIALETAARENMSPAERGLLLLIAAQISMLSSPAEGVAAYKTIATDESLSSALRAVALTQLVLAYYNAGTEIDRDILTAAIFTEEEPFGSMRPVDESAEAREAAYTALLTYADTTAPTALSSAYLARYWAKAAFHSTTTDEAVREGTRTNAEAYAARAQWMLQFGTTSENDLNVPTSQIILGVAETYLAALRGTEATGQEEGLERITKGMDALLKATEGLFVQYEEQSRPFVSQVPPAEIHQATHTAWRQMLEVAADLHQDRPDISARLANLYMEYIASEEGASERALASDPASDVAPLIKALGDAQILQAEALPVN